MHKMFFYLYLFSNTYYIQLRKVSYVSIHTCVHVLTYKYNVNDTLRLSLIGLYTIYVYIVYTCVLCNH